MINLFFIIIIMFNLIHPVWKWLQKESLSGPQIVGWLVMDYYIRHLSVT